MVYSHTISDSDQLKRVLSDYWAQHVCQTATIKIHTLLVNFYFYVHQSYCFSWYLIEVSSPHNWGGVSE